MYEYIKYGADRKIALVKNTYTQNDNLAIQMISHDGEFPEPWNSLTVNLSGKCDTDCAFIDVNNNGADIINWLIKNDIAHPTGRTEVSGFCAYPEVKFTKRALCDMDKWM